MNFFFKKLTREGDRVKDTVAELGEEDDNAVISEDSEVSDTVDGGRACGGH